MKGRWGVMAMGREMADVQGVDGHVAPVALVHAVIPATVEENDLW